MSDSRSTPGLAGRSRDSTGILVAGLRAVSLEIGDPALKAIVLQSAEMILDLKAERDALAESLSIHAKDAVRWEARLQARIEELTQNIRT